MQGRVAQPKQTDIPIENPQANHVTEPIDNIYRSEGIPTELFQMFSLDLATASPSDITKLKDISNWVMDGEMFTGDGLLKVREMMERIPQQTKNRHEAVWNLLKLQNEIDVTRKEIIDMEKRKSALMDQGYNHRRPY